MKNIKYVVDKLISEDGSEDRSISVAVAEILDPIRDILYDVMDSYVSELPNKDQERWYNDVLTILDRKLRLAYRVNR